MDTDFLPPVGKKTGLIPRDYSTHPTGYLAAAQPFPKDLIIPEVEWPERYKEMRAKKAGLLELREAYYDKLKSLDQNGFGLCHTADTEVLTEKGWVAWPDYDWARPSLLATVNPVTQAMEFQLPFQKHVYEYDGEMVYSTNRRMDFGVTPDHRMYVRKWDEAKRTLSNQYTFQRAGELGWYLGLMHAPRGWIGTELVEVEVPGDRRYDGDDFIALISLVVSDGFASSYDHSGNLVSFASFRPEARNRVAALAQRLGFKEQPSRPGIWNRWGCKALCEWIRANCYTGDGFKAQHKRVPDIIKCASRRQIELFLTWNGDQNHNRKDHGEHYYSTSKRMIDDLQELCLRVGRRGTISRRDARTAVMPQGTESTSRESWDLMVSKTDMLCIDKKKHLEHERYKGPVYCAAVPNGTLITRRNGSVLISGNCWAFSSTKATMYVRVKMGLTPQRLSAWYVAGNVVNWRDEGYWGAASLEFITKNGVPLEEKCPKYSRNAVASDAAENAKENIISEWWDGYDDPELNYQIAVTCALQAIPFVIDLNSISHSMCGIDVDERFNLMADNSWNDTDQYGPKGIYICKGRDKNVNGLVIPRVAIASQV